MFYCKRDGLSRMGPVTRHTALTMDLLVYVVAVLVCFNTARAEYCYDFMAASESACDVPERLLSVSYGDEPLECDTTSISPEDAAEAPSVTYDGPVAELQGERYLLVMVDPDAPSRKNPKFRYWLHWVVADISPKTLASGETLKGRTLIEYNGPTPPKNTGFHRYQFYLYEQPSKEVKGVPKSRDSFNLQQFAEKNKLCDKLVASFQFQTKNKIN